MYIAARRQSNSTRLAGLAGAAIVMASVGVVLVGMRQTIVTPLTPRTVFIVPPEATPSPIEPLQLSPPTHADPIPVPPIAIPMPPIVWDPVIPRDAPPVDTGDPHVGTPVTVTPSPGPNVVGPPATRPKLNAGAKPEYPMASIRAKEAGTTTLNLCVSRTGQVTQASVSSSSGYARLDQAALAWIKHERFKPGTENGQPVDMCNHTLAYVWQLPKN